MTDYKKYNSTVKTVQIACEQSADGYHLSEGDLRALKYAIDDLVSIYNEKATPALELSLAGSDKQPYWED